MISIETKNLYLEIFSVNRLPACPSIKGDFKLFFSRLLRNLIVFNVDIPRFTTYSDDIPALFACFEARWSYHTHSVSYEAFHCKYRRFWPGRQGYSHNTTGKNSVGLNLVTQEVTQFMVLYRSLRQASCSTDDFSPRLLGQYQPLCIIRKPAQGTLCFR